MRKSIFILIFVALIMTVNCPFVFAHSGGTDSCGGHWNHSTNEYHYHHGFPAHQHTNGICPYTHESDHHVAYYYIVGVVALLCFLKIKGVSITKKEKQKKSNIIEDNTHIAPVTEKKFDSKCDVENVIFITSFTTSNEISQCNKNYEICPRCGGKLILKNGPYGRFYGCSNYRVNGCRYTKNNHN